MTQQNASLVEETASASEEMANQAQELLDMMQKFKIRTATAVKPERMNQPRTARPAAQKNIKKETAGQGKARPSAARKPAASAEDQGSMKKLLEQEGFEEF